MGHQLQATPDQVLTILCAAAGGVVALAVWLAAWRWWNRPTAVRRRSVAADVRVLERGTR